MSSEAFSLGVVLFELATGIKPYSASRLASLQDYAGEEGVFWAHADVMQAGEELRNGNVASLFFGHGRREKGRHRSFLSTCTEREGRAIRKGWMCAGLRIPRGKRRR